MNSRVAPVRDTGRRSRRQWVWLALLAGFVAGCDLPGQPKAGERYVRPQNESTFRVLFEKNCVGCHGPDGTLGPAPPLNDKLFLSLTSSPELLRVITEGRPGTLMPAFAVANGGHLLVEQVRVLADGIKQTWGPDHPAPGGKHPMLIDPKKPAGAGDPEAGMRAFARACAVCHGSDGEGGKYGSQPNGKSVGSVRDPDFLALISDQALRRLVITGRPDLGMPDYADSLERPSGYQPLNSEEITDIVGLMASWRRAGSARSEGN